MLASEMSIRAKLVIGALGQSNMVRRSPCDDWEVPSNLLVWNNSNFDIGTKFIRPDSGLMNCGWAFAAEAAKSMPDVDVYVIGVARGATPIAFWLRGGLSPDMYLATKTNIEKALAAIGVDKLDIALWWQGESDVRDQDKYPSRFKQFVDGRLYQEKWFSKNTPMVIFGIADSKIAGDKAYSRFAKTLLSCAKHDQQSRIYVNTSAALRQSFWSDALHATGDGYRLAGSYGWKIFSRRNSFWGRLRYRALIYVLRAKLSFLLLQLAAFSQGDIGMLFGPI